MSDKKEISVSFSYTHSLGNYESCKVNAGITKSIDDDKDCIKEMKKEIKKLEKFVVDEANEIEMELNKLLN